MSSYSHRAVSTHQFCLITLLHPLPRQRQQGGPTLQQTDTVGSINPPSPHMTNEFNYPFYVLHPLPPILKFSLPSTGPLLTALPVTALKTSTKDFVVGNTPDGQTAFNSQTKRLSWATVNWLTASSSVGGSSGGGAGTSNSSES